MSDDDYNIGDLFKVLKKENQEKREANGIRSTQLLNAENIEYKQLSETHYRVGDFDYWPSTGLIIDRKSKRRWRGVKKLIQLVKQSASGGP